MRIMTLLSAVIVSAFLFGCSTMPALAIGRTVPAFASTLRCHQGNCFVPVNVRDCVVDVPDDVVSLGGPGAGRERAIVWLIKDSGYLFSTDPSVPALDPKGSGSFFGTPMVHGVVMMATVSVTSQNTSHEYGLNIVKSDGTKCKEYDPWVIE